MLWCLLLHIDRDHVRELDGIGSTVALSRDRPLADEVFREGSFSFRRRLAATCNADARADSPSAVLDDPVAAAAGIGSLVDEVGCFGVSRHRRFISSSAGAVVKRRPPIRMMSSRPRSPSLRRRAAVIAVERRPAASSKVMSRSSVITPTRA
jgi:hypothetical protein